jgi:hypothetical protein
MTQGRYSEAVPLMKRALAIREKFVGPDNPNVRDYLSNLATIYDHQDNFAEAEQLMKRVIAITEKALGPDHPDVGAYLSDLATLYFDQRRYSDAEPLAKRALAISEKALGPDHPSLGTALNNMAQVYERQGRHSEAEPLMKRALAIHERALGPDHPKVVENLNNLAVLYFSQNDWEHAVEFWRRSTSVIIRRARRGTFIGDTLTGKRRSETQQLSWQFGGLVKAAFRLASERHDDSPLRDMFQTAQWAQSSEAAESLSQMAARGAKGDARLAALVRERQDLVAEWQKRDAARSASVAQNPEKRDAQAEAANVSRLAAIDSRIAEIDKRLGADFPDYAALASPAPLAVEDVQAQLGADEALVLLFDTPEFRSESAPEETIIWVVTKTDVRWVRSERPEFGIHTLTYDVAALRCGLDYEGSWTDSHCSDLLEIGYTRADHDVFGKPLPFDLARAYRLYQGLFGQIEDLIKNKHLLIVPSGPLTQLPFQVLVQSVSNDVPSGERSREVARLGAQFVNLSDEERKHLQLTGDGGVKIVKVAPDTAAEAAGLKPEDIVLSLDGTEYPTYQRLIAGIQDHAPGTKVKIHILRNAADFTVTAILRATTIREWIPRFLANGEGKNVNWLVRDHAITVLPAVSSLKALREFAKESHASEPYIGFGNPLLNGPNARYKT